MIQLLILIGTGFWAYNPDYWHTQMMFGQIGVVAWISYKIARRINIFPAFAFFYFGVFSSLCMYSSSRISIPGKDISLILNAETARSFCFLLSVTIPFIFATASDLKWWKRAFQIFAAIDSIMMIYRYFMTGAATGLIGMDSVDGTFVCLSLPLIIFSKEPIKEDKQICAVLILCAALMARSSTVFAVLCLEALLWAFLVNKKSLRFLALLLCSGLLAYPIGRLYLGSELLQNNGRRDIHILSYNTFKQVGAYWFGLGTGSFEAIMPTLQGLPERFFVFLHDEPLQILFEQGAIGFGLLLALYGVMIWRNRGNIPMLLVLIPAGFQSFLQPCFRYWLFAIFMAFLCRISFEENDCLLAPKRH